MTALFAADTSRDALTQALAHIAEIGPLRFDLLEERDWIREFRENLAPLSFGRLWICPTGIACPDPAGIRIELDPGLAFGSGSHPTTALCLRWLAELDLRGRRVLDWGCGSGVLSLAALALGAAEVTAVDIDPQALQATADNAARNTLRQQLTITAAPEATGTHHVLVANILADTLIALAPTVRAHCVTGAPVALSGILTTQAARVVAACAPWMTLRLAAERGDWALLAGTTI